MLLPWDYRLRARAEALQHMGKSQVAEQVKTIGTLAGYHDQEKDTQICYGEKILVSTILIFYTYKTTNFKILLKM